MIKEREVDEIEAVLAGSGRAGRQGPKFGHSMGALLAFELLHALRAEGPARPVCSLFSGKLPPHYTPDKQRHLLSDEELWNEVARMGGTPAELLASSKLKQLFIEVLRRDFQLVETYRLVAGRKPLNGSVMILYGHGDTMARWLRQSR